MSKKEICKIQKYIFTNNKKYVRINTMVGRWCYMEFKNLRVKNVRSVLRYRPNIKKWSAKKRKDHIVGIQLHGSARHDFGYQKFVLSGNCIFFFN